MNTTIDDAAVGQRVKHLRQRSRLSQEKFARILGIKQSTLSGIESGSARLTAEHGMILRREFKISLDWIFDGEEN